VEFCVPATKANVTPATAEVNDVVGQPLQNDFICYTVKCPNDIAPRPKLVTDQFGQRLEQKAKPAKICVPAKKTPLGCNLIPGTNTCGGNCPDPTQTCGLDTNGTGCICSSKATCDGKPDKAGACGGACTNSNQRCLPDATGSCSCQDPVKPLCGLNTATGQCGGNCPNAVDTCRMDPTGKCTCSHTDKPPCGKDADGACSGECPLAGQTCGLDPTGICTCTPLAPCRQNSLTGTCGGECPTGYTCGLVPGTNNCDCWQGTPCGWDANGTCGGTCPVPGRQECKPDAVAGTCNCDPPSCGSVSPITGSCTSGACPSPKICQVIAAASGQLDYCGCVEPSVP
jgi:hypothetical protein